MPNRRSTRKNRILSSVVNAAGNILKTAELMAENAANTVVGVPFNLVTGAKNVLKTGVRRTTHGVTRIASRGAHGVENAFGKLVSRKNSRKDSRKDRKDSRKSSRKNSRKDRKDSRKDRKDRKDSRKDRKDRKDSRKDRKNRKNSRKNRK